MATTLYHSLLVVVLVSSKWMTAHAAFCNSDFDCENGGSCPFPSTAPCTCQGSFSGDACEEACTDETHCQNGGTCNIGNTPKDCTCASGFYGVQCGDACTDGTHCQNGGTCNIGNTPKDCTCASGFYGVQCGDAYTDANRETQGGDGNGVSSLKMLMRSLFLSLLALVFLA